MEKVLYKKTLKFTNWDDKPNTYVIQVFFYLNVKWKNTISWFYQHGMDAKKMILFLNVLYSPLPHRPLVKSAPDPKNTTRQTCTHVDDAVDPPLEVGGAVINPMVAGISNE